MTKQDNYSEMTLEEKKALADEWSKNEFVKVQKYCISQGIQPKSVKHKKCQLLPPKLGVWYVASNIKGEDYWVLSGELPTDLVPAKMAKNARVAIRHFSMSWQLKAANIDAAIAEGKMQPAELEVQEKYMKELTSKAENLYLIAQDENLWVQTGLKMD